MREHSDHVSSGGGTKLLTCPLLRPDDEIIQLIVGETRRGVINVLAIHLDHSKDRLPLMTKQFKSPVRMVMDVLREFDFEHAASPGRRRYRRARYRALVISLNTFSST
jgi:hypothetical protein